MHYLINVPKGLALDPTWRSTLAEPGSHQPRLLIGRERHYQPAEHSQWGAIRERSVGLLLGAGCRGLQCPLRRFHLPVHSQLHSRHSRCEAIRTSFPIHGYERVCSVPLSQLGIKSSYRAPFRQLGRCLFLKPPAFFHRFMVTLQPLWPKGRLVSLPTLPFWQKPREGLHQGPSPRGGNFLHYIISYSVSVTALCIYIAKLQVTSYNLQFKNKLIKIYNYNLSYS